MWKSIVYVVKENLTNLYRIYSISKYELLADMRDSKFGIFGTLRHQLFKSLRIGLCSGLPGEEVPRPIVE